MSSLFGFFILLYVDLCGPKIGKNIILDSWYSSRFLVITPDTKKHNSNPYSELVRELSLCHRVTSVYANNLYNLPAISPSKKQ
jgi:hypothetical protein